MDNNTRKIATVADRLHEVMDTRGLRQIDILDLVRPFCEERGLVMTKSDMSFYCSGKAVPAPEKLAVLSLALNVSQAWLSGFDVDMDPDDIEQQVYEIIDFERRVAKINKSILDKVGGFNLAILFWRASEEDRSRVREILEPYSDDRKFIGTFQESGYLDLIDTGILNLPKPLNIPNSILNENARNSANKKLNSQ